MSSTNTNSNSDPTSPSPDDERVIQYDDDRFGDLYVVHLAGDRVLRVERFIDRVGFDPIVYLSLADVPTAQRHAIEQLLP